MKKNYISLVAVFIFSLFFSFSSQAQIVANSDVVTVVHSNDVRIVIPNILGNDTLNGLPVSLSNVTVSQISTTENLSINPDGSVVLAANAHNGNYELEYRICEIANPGNCATSYVGVYVVSAPIVATPDNVTISTGLISPQIILEDVLANDTLGGLPIGISDVTIHQISSTATEYFNIDPVTGNILQISNPPPGNYTINYYYCENGNPNNCTEASAMITVLNSLSTAITSSYQDFNADGVTSVGDVINYTYSITNHAATAITNISITSSEVNIDGGPPIANLNPSATDSTTYTGLHVITQEDINNGYVVVSIQTNGTLSGNPISITTPNTRNLNISNGIRLNAFVDYNSNGTQDSGEPSVNYGSFQYQLNDNGITHNITSSSGEHYMYETNPANSYDFGYTLDSYYAAQYIITPGTFSNVTVPNGSGIVSYNFALSSLNPRTNLALTTYSSPSPRPGFTYHSYVYYYNNGNQTIPSGTITFTNSTNVSITGYPAGATQTATGFTYNFTNLFPGQSRVLDVTLEVPLIPIVSLGDTVINTASATTSVTETTLNDNTSSDWRIIVGSYDPNEKSESHGGKIVHSTFTANDYLTYTILFENTGTAEAINIRVTDVLDTKLDENSVRMITASGPYILERIGRNLTWKFDGINLPPSSSASTTIGHGYIVFQVKPKPGYVVGDVIPNIASIYFDFNPAIVTNPCLTEFVVTLDTPRFAFNNFNYYPNPVTNSLFVSNGENIDTIEISSVLGQRVFSRKINNLDAEINLAGLQKGIYFVKVTSNGQQKTVKIIKD